MVSFSQQFNLSFSRTLASALVLVPLTMGMLSPVHAIVTGEVPENKRTSPTAAPAPVPDGEAGNPPQTLAQAAVADEKAKDIIFALPPEVLIQVFEWTSFSYRVGVEIGEDENEIQVQSIESRPPDFLSMALTCRAFRALSEDSVLQRDLVLHAPACFMTNPVAIRRVNYILARTRVDQEAEGARTTTRQMCEDVTELPLATIQNPTFWEEVMARSPLHGPQPFHPLAHYLLSLRYQHEQIPDFYPDEDARIRCAELRYSTACDPASENDVTEWPVEKVRILSSLFRFFDNSISDNPRFRTEVSYLHTLSKENLSFCSSFVTDLLPSSADVTFAYLSLDDLEDLLPSGYFPSFRDSLSTLKNHGKYHDVLRCLRDIFYVGEDPEEMMDGAFPYFDPNHTADDWETPGPIVDLANAFASLEPNAIDNKIAEITAEFQDEQLPALSTLDRQNKSRLLTEIVKNRRERALAIVEEQQL